MKRTWLVSSAMAFALTAGAGAAWAEDVTGMVRYIDPANRTIYFADDKAVQLKPGARIMINGREVAFDAITPGTTIVVRDGALVSSDARVMARDPGRLVSNHPPVDAAGTIARIDRQAGLVTFEDGRVMKMAPGSDVWQSSQVDRLQPGMYVLIREAHPVAFQSSLGDQRFGRVRHVDAASNTVVLYDGTVVRLNPRTKFRMGQETVTITDLRPGDQVIVSVHPPAAAVGSALPREAVAVSAGTATIVSDDIQIIRRPQAP